jgi:hypothetical protein
MIVALALALVVASTTPAAAAPVGLQHVASGVSAAVGGGGDGGYAYLATPTSLVVQTASARRAYAVPPGCAPTALASDAVALACPDVYAPIVMLLPYGTFRAVSIPPGAVIHTLALGTEWLLGDDEFSPDGVHGEDTTYAIDWRSGRTIELGQTDPIGAHAYPDLDDPGLRAPLCAPAVRLSRGNDAPFEQTRYATLAKVGPWILESTDRSFVVKRCGRAGDVVHLTISPSLTGAVLGTDTLAYLDHRRIELETLPTAAPTSIPWPASAAPQLALSGRRLLVSEPQPDQTYAIYATKATRHAGQPKGPG